MSDRSSPRRASALDDGPPRRQAARHQQSVTLRIGVLPSANVRIMPALMREFAAAHPDVRVTALKPPAQRRLALAVLHDAEPLPAALALMRLRSAGDADHQVLRHA